MEADRYHLVESAGRMAPGVGCGGGLLFCKKAGLPLYQALPAAGVPDV